MEWERSDAEPKPIRLEGVSIGHGERLGFHWSPNGDLFVFCHKDRPQKNLGRSDPLLQIHAVEMRAAGLHASQWQTPYRKLVNESCSVFLDAQKGEEDVPVERRQDELLERSRYYRALVVECAHRYREDFTAMNDTECRDWSDEYGFIDRIWHLFEIFCLTPAVVVTPFIVNWLKYDIEEIDYSEVKNEEPPDSHSNYWDCLYRLLVTGRKTEAEDLLRLHSQLYAPDPGVIGDPSKRDPLFVALGFLQSMPVMQPDTVVADFVVDWKTWKDDCMAAVRTRADLTRDPNLRTLFNILTGDEGTLMNLTKNWRELLVAHASFLFPTMKKRDVGPYVTRCVMTRDKEQLVDRIYQQIMNLDVINAIQLCRSSLGNAWFAAHLTDLLFHAGHIEPYPVPQDASTDLRERLLLEYGTELLADRSMWQIASTYFAYCETQGSAYLDLMLEHQPLETEKKALKLLKTCLFYNRNDVSCTTAAVMGMQRLHQSRYGAAISWFLRAGNKKRISTVSERVLDEFLASNNARDLDEVVENIDLGDQFTESHDLHFLRAYRELCKIMDQIRSSDPCSPDTYQQAAGYIEKLLTLHPRPTQEHWSLAPRSFWLLCLRDALGLIEVAPSPVFDLNATRILMSALQEITTSHRKNEYLHGATKDELKKIRLALARNLSRVVMNVSQGV